jgi:CubicO group peptidase (beta-lactamase class C family)
LVTRRQLITGAAVAVPLVGAAAAHAEPLASDIGAGIDAVLAAQREAEHLSGIAFLAVRDGVVVHSATLGTRNRESAAPVTLDTLFPIGSATKSFTAMAVGLAQDAGRLSLDDRPHGWLPYFHMADPEANARITLRDMLSHRTGLRAYADLAAEPGVLTREEYVRAATSARPEAPFRSRFQYSNAQYAAVGEVLAHVHGVSWEEVMAREIFAPLGMASTRASLLDLASAPDAATGYVHDAGQSSWTATPPPRSLVAMAPGGAIAASARDLARWLLMLTGGGEIDGRRFVSAATLAELIRPMAALNPTVSYALGWAAYDLGGERVVEHNGGSSGISALVSFMPARRCGFVFLANASPNAMTRIGGAGTLIYPLLLNRPMAPARPVSAAVAGAAVETDPEIWNAAPGPVDALIARMVKAERNPKAGFEAQGVKRYENHGVEAALTLRAHAPAAREEIELWSAADRRIARLRVYFDGARGGQETTFGQNAINGEAENRAARRANAVQPAAELRGLYPDIQLSSRAGDGDPASRRLKLTDADGGWRIWTVSGEGLVMESEVPGETVAFRDFRRVDERRLPFAWDIRNGLGLITVRLDAIRPVETFDPAHFAPAI